jgi:hypothetical protein
MKSATVAVFTIPLGFLRPFVGLAYPMCNTVPESDVGYGIPDIRHPLTGSGGYSCSGRFGKQTQILKDPGQALPGVF